MNAITMQYLEETYPGEDLDELKKMTKAQLIRNSMAVPVMRWIGRRIEAELRQKGIIAKAEA